MANDATIIMGILILFVATGLVLPALGEDFGGYSATNYSTTNMEELGNDVQGSGSSGIWDSIKSVFAVFFWTFGGLPFWLDALIFTPLRLVLAFLVARNIWIGGGA